MGPIYDQLPTSKGGLWLAFFIFITLSTGFLLVMKVCDFMIIDEMYKSDDIIAHIQNMSAAQKSAHIWTTATLDVAYPFSYAALFGGLTVTAFPHQKWLALPILICVPFDLIEGVTQIALLNDQFDWVLIKQVVTPIKFILLILSAIIGLVSLASFYR